ncbi:hypothetical protein TMEN_6779 [Trichophyton mentagrophytes]|nr:hypothetical protein TMEN_6779 [Trichophyton mentagrophytes]
MTIPTPCLVTGAAIRPGQKDGAFNFVFVRWLGDCLALTYTQFSDDNHRLLRSTGFEEKGSTYRYRKGAATALKNLQPELRNYIIGYIAGSSTFQSYINKHINCDVQSTFLGTATRDALIKLSTNSSLTLDPAAPQGLSDKQKENIRNHPKFLKIEEERIQYRDDLIAEYSMISKVTNNEKRQYYRKLYSNSRSTLQKLHKKAATDTYKAYFANIGNVIIEKNYHGETISFDPNTSSILPERRDLAAVKYKNRDASNVTDEEMVEDHIRSLEVRRILSRSAMPPYLTSTPSLTSSSKVKPPPNRVTGLESEQLIGFECPECLGYFNNHPSVRKFRFATPYSLRDHFTIQHLERMDFTKPIPCGFPSYGSLLNSKINYCSHTTKVHGTKLPSRY